MKLSDTCRESSEFTEKFCEREVSGVSAFPLTPSVEFASSCARLRAWWYLGSSTSDSVQYASLSLVHCLVQSSLAPAEVAIGVVD